MKENIYNNIIIIRFLPPIKATSSVYDSMALVLEALDLLSPVLLPLAALGKATIIQSCEESC